MNSSNTVGVHDKTDYRDYWTIWYNVDSPWDDGGDYETVERILKVHNTICNKGFQICAAQCRVHGHQGEVFNKDTYPFNNSDVLERRCTTEGIVCRNGDQSPGNAWCQDYQIQFRCHYNGDSPSSSNYFNSFDLRIYVILALVPLLLICCRMLWAYMYRRRQERERHPRLRESNRNHVNDLSKAPPSYQELFCKNGSPIFAISRENLPVCSLCQFKPCSVALIVKETKASKSPKGNKQTRELNADAPSQVVAETQTQNSIPNNVGIYSTNVEPRIPSMYQVASSSQETTVCLDSTETTKVYMEITPNQEMALETSQVNSVNKVNNNNNEISDEMFINRNIQIKHEPSSLPTSNEIHPSSSQSAISLNPESLTSSNISEPCACVCHRTIPPRQNGVSGYDNFGYTTNGTESNKQPVYINTHRPVFDNNGVQSDSALPSSLTQLELPSYEDALELMKLKEREQNEQALMLY